MKKKRLPSYVEKYFWGDDLNILDWEKHNNYIIQTLLEKGDFSSVSWLFQQVEQDKLRSLLPNLKMSLKSKNFWQMYLS